MESLELTSYLALTIETGFKSMPTVTLAVAPASKLPWFARTGRTDVDVLDVGLSFFWKCRDSASTPRIFCNKVKYIATPGTFLQVIKQIVGVLERVELASIKLGWFPSRGPRDHLAEPPVL